jgi:membrane fusion protein (multidrug efflux system)
MSPRTVFPCAARKLFCSTLLLAGALFSLVAPAAAEAPPVVVAEAAVVRFPLVVEGLGTARSRESVEIRPELSERIAAIHFTEGQRVEADQVLVELEARELRAAVASARATLVESEGQLRRARDLHKTNALSDQELETRKARRDADRAALDAAQARLSQTVVRAPFAGRLGLRNVSPGSYVSPETVLTTLDDTDVIKLDFDVPETALSRLAEGLPVAARSAAWPDARFEGKVDTIDTRVDPVSRTVRVRALVPNPNGKLRPGMFLTVTVAREDVMALAVPEQAIVPEQSSQYVFVVGAEDVVEKRAVRTGRRRPGQVEILDGLGEGELVIAEGTQQARPGAAVKIVGRITLDGARTAATEAAP